RVANVADEFVDHRPVRLGQQAHDNRRHKPGRYAERAGGDRIHAKPRLAQHASHAREERVVGDDVVHAHGKPRQHARDGAGTVGALPEHAKHQHREEARRRQ
ncbi:hypothetical protein COLO4_01131, partial [Corchorus olitorius]